MPSAARPTPAVEATLRDAFGLEAFRPGQREVIDALLAGRSALAVLPTGGGKSLCYQLPALLLEGLTLVVSPLIALMKDQVDALRARGLEAARLDSSVPGPEARDLYRRLGQGRLRLLYVAPERLANEGFLARLRGQRIALLAIDEAHCISEWGHNFRPDYLKLAEFARAQRVERVLALTATATPAVARDVCAAFGVAPGDHVQTTFRRPNLALHVTPCPAGQRTALLAERLLAQGGGAAVVYVTLQHTAEQVAEALAGSGLSARAYHAGLPSEERSAVQDAFMAGACQVVVATIAFGMGIDKADIRAVYHYNLPKTLENYVQEIGRAGRDGAPARCELLACADDTVTLGNFTYGDTPDRAAVAALVRDLLGRGERFSISRWHLAREHDLRDLVLDTLLTYLELEGVLRPTGPFYTGYQFELLRPEREVLARFDPGRQAFLQRVFGAAKKGRRWSTIEPEEVATRLREPRERIVAALQYLEEQGELAMKPSGLRHGYARGERAVDEEALIATLAARFEEREARDAERLTGLVALCEQPGCLVRRLLAYFGEPMSEDCGSCSRCAGEPPRPLPATPRPPLEEAEAALVRTLVEEGNPALSTPRQLARFLCALPSPAATQARLRGHPRFGWLAPVPFPEVLALVTRVLGGSAAA